eukprot:4450715-Prorocentrum_lima.AAC.1
MPFPAPVRALPTPDSARHNTHEAKYGVFCRFRTCGTPLDVHASEGQSRLEPVRGPQCQAPPPPS